MLADLRQAMKPAEYEAVEVIAVDEACARLLRTRARRSQGAVRCAAVPCLLTAVCVSGAGAILHGFEGVLRGGG